MVQLTAPDHAKAVNLARRFTAQNENDLMQESMFDDDEVGAVKLGKPDHAKAVNLARRFTAQNENDLMRKYIENALCPEILVVLTTDYHSLQTEESMLDEPEDNGIIAPKKEYNKEICNELAHHVIHAKYMPKECNQYSEAVHYAKCHDKDTTDPTQLLS